ncbi:MAG: hypothetical protein AAB942_00975 [Patescibacteria group bacterium]
MEATDLAFANSQSLRSGRPETSRRPRRRLINPTDFRQTFAIDKRYRAQAHKSVEHQGIIVTVMTQARNICSGFVPHSLIPEHLHETDFIFLVYNETSSSSPKRCYEVELEEVNYHDQFLVFRMIGETQPFSQRGH